MNQPPQSWPSSQQPTTQQYYQPSQGYQQPPIGQPPYTPLPPKKKGKGLIIGLVIVGAIVLLCSLGSVIAATASHTSNTGTLASSTPGQTTSAPQTQQHFKVGDTVSVGTWKVIVNDIKTDDGGQFSALKSGDTYVVVDVSMTNLSSSEQNVSSLLNFTFKDSTGQKYDESIDPNVNGSSPNGKVAAGDNLRGPLVYEVPAGQKSFTLAFAPDAFASGQTIWDLNLP